MEVKECNDIMEKRGYSTHFRTADYSTINYIKEYTHYETPESVSFPIFAKVDVARGYLELSLIKDMFIVSTGNISIDNKDFDSYFEAGIIGIGQRIFR